jgi:hypothetical protein
MKVHDLTAVSLVVGSPSSTPKRTRKPRKPTLVSVAKQAGKAGLAVARYEVEPDGKIIIVPGKPDEAPMQTNGHAKEENEWDEVFDGTR